jgi:hypothetical protein
MRSAPAIEFWSGDTQTLSPSLTLIRCSGHFAGGTVLHVAQGQGAILTGDVIQVAQDRRHVSFMYSYPNLIPVNATAVRQIEHALAPFEFDRIYGAWWGRNIIGNAREAVRRSVDRYLRAIA